MKVCCMNKTLLIHNDNVAGIDSFTHEIKFEPTFSDIDKYISLEIVGELKNKEFDIVYIKDNLSSNYLELYGLRVAYHIRLSEDLDDKRYVPIVILSDIDIYALNKLTPAAKILFTKNVFLKVNHFDTVKHFNELPIGSMTQDDYINKFLNLIDVEPSKDYLDHHDITNEWAIHQWSNALGATSDAIKINHDKISSMLYFKYLKALHKMSDDSEEQYEVISSKKKGKILYIDDEWNKGWSDILNTLFERSAGIKFETFEYEYKDTNKFSILKDIKPEIEKVDPDVVILDLRLSQTDHNKVSNIEQYTGIKVLKEIIKAINPGIQVIMMTATRQSVILEKLYDYGVLGYIKKEHPDDRSISTTENIAKLVGLVEDGVDRKYLKDIYLTKLKIENILENDIFAKFRNSDLRQRDILKILYDSGVLKYIKKVYPNGLSVDTAENINTLFKLVDKGVEIESLKKGLDKYISDKEKYEKFWIQLDVEITQVFDILSNSESQNKLKYAMVSVASSLEAILSIFIKEERGRDNQYWDGEYCEFNTLNTKLNALFYDKFGYTQVDRNRSKLKMWGMIDKRNKYLHSRDTVSISHDEVISWFNKLLKMIEIIKSPPNLRKYDTGNIVQNLNNAFNNR